MGTFSEIPFGLIVDDERVQQLNPSMVRTLYDPQCNTGLFLLDLT